MESMVRVHTWLRSSILLCVLLLASVAIGGPTPADKRAAAKLELEAEGLVRKGEREQAIEKFREADEKEPLIWRKYRMGKLLSDLARLTEAAEVLERALEEKAFATRERVARGKVEKLLPDIVSRIPTLTVIVVEPATGVSVEVDGKKIDTEGGAVSLDPGYHRVVATASGYEEMSQEVSLGEGKKETVEVRLVAIKTEGGEGAEGEGEGEEDEASEGIGLWPAGLMWGLGAVGLGFGIGFGVSAMNKTDELRETYGCVDDRCPSAAQDDLDTSKLYGNISTAGFVIGGAGVVLGFILLGVDAAGGDSAEEPDEADDASDEDSSDGEDSAEESEEELAKVRVLPLVGPGFAGLTGTF